MISMRKTCASVPAPTQAAENRIGLSKPIHNSIYYFIITSVKSQTFHVVDFLLDRRLRNALLSKYRVERIQLAIHRAKWPETRPEGQG